MTSGGEIVPIVGKEVSETTKPLRSAIGFTLSDTWQAVIGDKVQAWRLLRASEVSKKLSAKLAESGVHARLEEIPERYAYTWFEKATQEDESEIQDLFAELMAQALKGEKDALDRRSVDLVSRLTPGDAYLFKHLTSRFYEKPKWGRRSFKIDLRFLDIEMSRAGIVAEERSMDSLLSLGVIRVVQEIGVNQAEFEHGARRRLDGSGIGDLSRAVGVRNHLYLTDLGRMLCRALNLDEEEGASA